MDKVSIIPFKGTDVHILYKKGQLGYSFELDGKAYGQKVTLQGKSINDITSATFLLFCSMYESWEALKTNDTKK
jgi:hypothetical protein